MMAIVIKVFDHAGLASIDECNGEFIVSAKLCLHAHDGEITYTIVDVPPYSKQYPSDEIDLSTYIGHPDRVIFVAYVDDHPAGHIRLRKNWNRYAYVENIVVDVNHRRLGIGRRLIEQAKQWARSKNLPGIMLETQNNNVAACKLYETCGFKLRGFDTHLYKAIDPDTDEIALYWYLTI
jgi:ribosomal protein S18 acetylase RimI-like enzyme